MPVTSVSTDGLVQGVVDQALHTIAITFYGSWYNLLTNHLLRTGFDWGHTNLTDNSGPTANTGDFGVPQTLNTGSFSYVPGAVIPGYLTDTALSADTSYTFRARGNHFDDADVFIANRVGSTISFKANAVDMTFPGSGNASSITSSSASLQHTDFRANVNESSGTAWLEYRVFGSGSAWTMAQTADAGQSGYGNHSLIKSATGLLGSTTYEFRLHMTRNTNNNTDSASVSYTFTTLAGAPTITTDAATSIGSGSATLNGTVNPNGISTSYRFEYGLTTSYGTTTATQGPSAGSSPIAYSQAISGLSVSTVYHYRAVTVSGVLGLDATFTTTADPGTTARKARMPRMEHFWGIYGVQSDFYFSVDDIDTSSNNRFINAAVTGLWTITPSTDVQISKDGAAFANVATTPVRVGTSPLYKLTLSAAEMQATDILVMLVDQTGTPVWRDLHIHVRTKFLVGQLGGDATQIGGNTAGMYATGVGSLSGFVATGGTTARGDIGGILAHHVLRRSTSPTNGTGTTIVLDASASGTNDFYVGCIVYIYSGTGTDQFRIITAYNGTTKVATVHRTWLTTPLSGALYVIVPGADLFGLGPAAELSAVPATTASYGDKIQFLFQRFAFKRTQSPTIQTLFKADSSTTLATASVDDTGSLQTSGKLS
jgi:hypothetical protein